MMKLFLSVAGVVALLSPALFAQPVVVCILQAQPPADQATQPPEAQSDAATLAPMLSVAAGPGALTAIPEAGIAAKDMDAEAQKHGCAWIVSLRRGQTQTTELPFDRSPSAGATGGPLFGVSRGKGEAHIDFTLRRIGSKKIAGHGSSTRADWAALFPAEILQKLASGQ